MIRWTITSRSSTKKIFKKNGTELIKIRRGDTDFRYQVDGSFMIRRQLEHVNAQLKCGCSAMFSAIPKLHPPSLRRDLVDFLKQYLEPPAKLSDTAKERQSRY